MKLDQKDNNYSTGRWCPCEGNCLGCTGCAGSCYGYCTGKCAGCAHDTYY